MVQGFQIDMDAEESYCPECGSEESGYFCRNCGTLLRGEDQVLCPRCHQVVPYGDFCNQCGQSLGGIALQLRQLALAGDAFWVTAGTPVAPKPAELGTFDPDETVELVEAELPDWLHELPVQAAPPDVETRIYPALRPMEQAQPGSRRSSFFTVVILLMFLLMLGMVFLAGFVLLTAGR